MMMTRKTIAEYPACGFNETYTLNAGPPGIPVLKTQNSPRQRKNSRKFPFGKMLYFARSNIISTQTSNIYLNQLQWVWSVCTSVHATWSLQSWNLPKFQCHQHSIRPTCRDWPAAIDHRSVVSTIPPVRTDVPRTLPPLRTSSLEHLPSQADKSKTLACDLLELSQSPHSCNDLTLRNSDTVQWFFDISIWKYTGTL